MLDLLKQTHGPPGIDPQFECGWRMLAFKYASQKLQPWRSESSLQAVFDGLQLSALCNQTVSLSLGQAWQPEPHAPANNSLTVARAPLSAPLPQPTGQLAGSTFDGTPLAPASTLFVDIAQGSDSNPGTFTKPLQHVEVALAQSRGLPRPVALVLREGVYRLTSPLLMEADDSYLSLSAWNNETVVLSGGVVLTPAAWSPLNVSQQWEVYQGTNNVYGATPDGHHIINDTRTQTWQECQAVCTAYPGCTSFTWHDSVWPLEYNDTCWLRTDGVWSPTAEHDHTAGYPLNLNVWVADISPAQPFPARDSNSFIASLLYSSDGGVTTQRGVRARWPNANPEIDLYPTGWMSSTASPSAYYIKPPSLNVSGTRVVHVPLPTNYGPGMFTDYYWGYGETCERFASNASYWCQPNGRVAGAEYFVQQPLGFVYDNVTLPHAPYTHDPTGAVFNFWRQGHWFSLMGRVDTYNATTNSLGWSYGAFQGAEGEQTGEDWYLEWVQDELDYPNEFFIDWERNQMFYYYNGTGAPPSDWTFEVPFLSTLINISGSQAAPVTNITISGITFTATAPATLAPHDLPR